LGIATVHAVDLVVPPVISKNCDSWIPSVTPSQAAIETFMWNLTRERAFHIVLRSRKLAIYEFFPGRGCLV
jgi:hypothetical protein